ncbi:DUF5979 domain-containing protein [Leucobacter ruminantium]|uniref:DUF5979 domain-containing protein n=1 Tax=Leucobacter ruminantium TaxID=1289170 RepID=A0A939LWI5_9MICO|nr:hypothetical protein [Leucobacter ruminantium]
MRPGRSAAVLFSVLALIAGAFALPQAAHAATAATIDSVEFANDTFPGGSRQEINVAWSAPDNPSTPLTVTVPLPDELSGHADRFPAIDADGNEAGECVVAANQVVCTIDDAYVESHPVDISGTFRFLANVNVYNTEDVERTYDFGGVQAPPVTVTPNPAVCTEDCDFKGAGAWKGGGYNNLEDEIVWTVQVPAPADGMEAGLDITVTDLLDTSAFELVSGPAVREAGSVRRSPQTHRENLVWHTMPADLVTVSGDNLSASFTTRPGLDDDQPNAGDRGLTGSVYQVQWRVKVLDEGKAKTYQNEAEYTVEGQETRTVKGSATRYSGSGTVVGKNFGKFAVTKLLTGDARFNPAPEFTLNWTAYDTTDPTDPGTPGTATIRAGEPFFSQEFFKDTRVVITEVQPAGPANVTWGTPKFLAVDASGDPIPGADPTDSVEITFSADNRNLAKVSYFTLTNEATLDKAPIRAKKVVENPDGADLSGVPTYMVNYSYPASSTWAAGSGSLILPADGTVVASDALPVGAEVTLSEIAPVAIPGATWDAPVISPTKLVVGQDREAVVQVTNRTTKDLGAFSIRKTLSGDGKDLVPPGTAFQVHWSHPAGPGYEAGEGTVEVIAGGDPVTVDGLPAGAQVTLSEAAPDPITGGEWLDPVFSKTTFPVIKNETVTIDLDNPIRLGSGDFKIRKALEGTGAELVDPATTFAVGYSYPAGTGFQSGEGTIQVSADGSWASSGALPFGAEVTLAELDPAPVPGGTWQGHAFDPETFTIGDGTTVEVTLTNTISRDVGAFGLVKAVTGDAVHLIPEGTEYVFEYSYPAGDTFEAGEGTITVTAGGDPVSVGDLPAGAVVTLVEVAPEKVGGGTWQPVVFDGPSTFVIGKDATIVLEATNEISLNSGGFSVLKQIAGDGAGLVEDGTEFEVDFSYPAGEGFEAGAGTITVAANGEATVVDGLPYGAVVTLTEAAAVEVPGGTWQQPEFSTDTFTIGDGTVVEVELTNTITRDKAPASPTHRGLSNTGGMPLLPLGLGGAVLLCIGGVMVLSRRRSGAVE